MWFVRIPLLLTIGELDPAPRKFLLYTCFNVVSFQCIVGAVLVLGWAAWFATGVPALAGLAGPVLAYACVLLLVDVLLPFFPMTAYAGRRMLEASRWGWAAMAAATVGLWVVWLAG